MDAAEHEAVWAKARAMVEAFSHDEFETHRIDTTLRGLHYQAMEYALQGQDRAMAGGDAATAMRFLEVALDARTSVFGLSHGIYGFAPLNYLDAVPLWDAAAASRPDLIDRAIALEEANRDAAGGGEGRYDRRIAAIVRVKESIPFLDAIRGAVERDPGIRQINLTALCPGADNAKISRLVGQLASAGVLIKERISSRVCVWPAGHPGIPAGEQRMAPGNSRELTPEEFWC